MGGEFMLKRIISIFITLSMLVSTICVSGQIVMANSTGTQIILNEVFDDYALNSVPDSFTINGLDARVAQRTGGNKALYGKLWGSDVDFSFPVKSTDDSMVFSFDIMVKGDSFEGSILKLGSSASLLKLTSLNKIKLEDGYTVGGYGNGRWNTYTAAINFKSNTYDFYVNGKKLLDNWIFNKKPTKPTVFDFSFSSVDENTESEVFVDNIRVYTGDNILPESEIFKKKVNSEIKDFTPSKEKPEFDQSFIESSGKTGLGAISFVNKTNTKSGWQAVPGEKTQCVHFLQTGKDDTFIDLTTGIKSIKSLVFQTDIYPVSFENASVMVARMINRTTGLNSNVLAMNKEGKLLSGTTVIAELPMNKWSTVAAICNYKTATCDIYIDGKLVKKGLAIQNGAVIPETIRMGLSGVSDPGTNEVYFNNIKLYGGDALREYQNNTDAGIDDTGYITTNDTREDAIAMIDKDVIFMTSNDFCFFDGKRQTYTSLGYPRAYKDEAGIIMVPAELIAKGLRTDIKFETDVVEVNGKKLKLGEKGELDSAPVEKDGVLFLPVSSFAQKILSKYVYEDVRGFVLIANSGTRNWYNSSVVGDNMEPVDIIYRYMEFERPTGDEIYDAVIKNSHDVHPRLFIRKEEISTIKNNILKNKDIKNEFVALLEECEGIMNSAPTQYSIPDGLRLFGSCHSVREIVYKLSVAYMITDDEKYLERMWEEVKNALSWKDWNVDAHFLDSGEIGPGIAMAYDMLSDYLTEEEKAYFRKRVTELYLDFAVGVYTGTSSFKATEPRMVTSNWGAVCSSSMFLVALSFIDAEPEDSEFTKKCKFVAENAYQSLEYAIGIMYPDGGAPDGTEYNNYYIEGLSWSANAMRNMCGTDFGMSKVPGYQEMLDFVLYIQSVNGVVNYNDSPESAKTTFAPELFLIPKFNNDAGVMELANNHRKALNEPLGAFGILWYNPSQDKGIDLDNFPLGNNFSTVGVTTHRSSWSGVDQTFLGMRYGPKTTLHHFDKGTFIFEAGGERWFYDYGKENPAAKNPEGGGDYYQEGRYMLYTKRAEGHNCLVINPAYDHPGQSNNTAAHLIRSESKQNGAITVYDLSDSYKDHVLSYNRGFYLGEGRNTLIVQDELELKEAANEIYSFFHTKGKITINEDKKGAVIELNGKKLKVEAYCDSADWHLENRESKAMFPENEWINVNSRKDYSVLTLVTNASGKLNISFKFSLLDDGISYEPLAFVPISSWTISDAEIPKRPKLDTLYVNSKLYDEFTPNKKEYTVDVYVDEATPYIEAYSNDGTVSIKQPEYLGDGATITVTNKIGQKVVYEISFNVIVRTTKNIIKTNGVEGLPETVSFAEISNIYSNHIPQPENPPDHVADGDLTTRWASDMSGAYLEVDLGEVMPIDGVGMVFNYGKERIYRYDILVSDDGINYRILYEGNSIGADSWEYLSLNQSARYIRYVGYGHSVGEWNNICELRPCIKK